MDETTDKVNEPAAEYKAGGKRIAFFKSFEEAAEADYEFYRKLTPVERIALHYELSIKMTARTSPALNQRFSFDV